MKTIINLSLLVVLVFSLPALAKNSTAGDPLSLAALMIKDGHFHRAKEILAEVDTSKKNFDLKRYHLLGGISSLKTAEYDLAITHFKQAIKHGQTDEILYVYLSQAAYKKNDFAASVSYVDQAPNLKRRNINLILMKFDALKQQGKTYQAWNALNEGIEYFPQASVFPKQRIFTLIELGFYQQAAAEGLEFIKNFDATADDYIAIGTALSKANNSKLAVGFLESARLSFPNNIQASKALANHYSSQKQFYSAAKLMEPLAVADSNLLIEAAELNKLSHQYFRALFLNSRSSDQQGKLKQRLALYLQHSEYELASLMEKDLSRNKVLTDDNVRYALAYAHFKVGKYDSAEKQLSKIKDTRLFNKANQIRSIMLNCQKNLWKCRE